MIGQKKKIDKQQGGLDLMSMVGGVGRFSKTFHERPSTREKRPDRQIRTPYVVRVCPSFFLIFIITLNRGKRNEIFKMP